MAVISILNPDNYLSINKEAIKIFGLTSASYLSILVSIYDKAKRKNKLIDDEFFSLDRNYVFKQLQLTIEEQLAVDEKLVKINLMKRYVNNPDIIKLDLNLYMSILANEDVKLDERLKKATTVKSTRASKESAKKRKIKELKGSIKCSNDELREALEEWVESVLQSPKSSYFNENTIKIFQETLNNYTKGDLDVALRIVKIATVQSYRLCDWAINIYEKSEKDKKNVATKSNIYISNVQKKIDSEKELSNVVF